MAEQIIFFILAAFAIFGSVGVIWSRQPVFATANLLIVMLALAGFFIMLHLSFLFLTQILIAVGAVVAITLLVISSINIKQQDLPKEKEKGKWTLASVVLLIPFVVVIMQTISEQNLSLKEVSEGYGSLKIVGLELFKDYVVPFELISVLLLAILIGAVVVVRKGMSK